MRPHHGSGAWRAFFLLLAAAAALVACGSDAGGTDTGIEPTPAIGLSVPAASLPVSAGGTAEAVVSVTRSGGYVGAVHVALESPPEGVTGSPVTIPANGTSGILSVSAADDVPAGARMLRVRATGDAGGPAAVVTLALTVVESPPAAEPPPAASLDGIYLGFRVSGTNGNLYQDFWTFFPNGRVAHSDPYEGLGRPVDLALLCERFSCGTYTRQGSELRIRWGAGTEETIYDVDASGAFNERGKTQKYRPLAFLDGLRLNAAFAEMWEGDSALVRLRLTADGRFDEESLQHYTGWARYDLPGEPRTARPGGAGRYEIRRNTLALRYDDGQVAYFTIVIPPGEIGKSAPDVIHVNGARIARVP